MSKQRKYLRCLSAFSPTTSTLKLLITRHDLTINIICRRCSSIKINDQASGPPTSKKHCLITSPSLPSPTNRRCPNEHLCSNVRPGGPTPLDVLGAPSLSLRRQYSSSAKRTGGCLPSNWAGVASSSQQYSRMSTKTIVGMGQGRRGRWRWSGEQTTVILHHVLTLMLVVTIAETVAVGGWDAKWQWQLLILKRDNGWAMTKDKEGGDNQPGWKRKWTTWWWLSGEHQRTSLKGGG